ncbi:MULTISPECIES: hypothetical protein [unclassified Candidatus Tisiphia]|uniref:hypothetical protein n=1 Tax=unclassified Candidatus Tisiphia TaxID=2996318 RepID=UPI00312C9880
MTSCTLTFFRQHSRNSSFISIHATMPLRMMDDYKIQGNLKAYYNVTSIRDKNKPFKEWVTVMY